MHGESKVTRNLQVKFSYICTQNPIY
jgi:hypothetical protein